MNCTGRDDMRSLINEATALTPSPLSPSSTGTTTRLLPPSFMPIKASSKAGINSPWEQMSSMSR